ncbi:MAG TPA: hypothetical protein VGK79_14585 [Gaiellaceae bacterium]
MRRSAVLVVLLALVAAGCGGTKSTSPPTAVGTETTENFLSPTFKASANAIAREVSADVAALRSHLRADAQVSGSLIRQNCLGSVKTQLVQKASSQQERQIARTLDVACQDLSRAVGAAQRHDTGKAKQLIADALSQAKLAARASG